MGDEVFTSPGLTAPSLHARQSPPPDGGRERLSKVKRPAGDLGSESGTGQWTELPGQGQASSEVPGTPCFSKRLHPRELGKDRCSPYQLGRARPPPADSGGYGGDISLKGRRTSSALREGNPGGALEADPAPSCCSKPHRPHTFLFRAREVRVAKGSEELEGSYTGLGPLSPGALEARPGTRRGAPRSGEATPGAVRTPDVPSGGDVHRRGLGPPACV